MRLSAKKAEPRREMHCSAQVSPPSKKKKPFYGYPNLSHG